jgi:Zn-dependent alcohol dehydrogenase
LKVYRRGYHAKMLTQNRLFGHEVAGTVTQVGDGVKSFIVGDRVVPLLVTSVSSARTASKTYVTICSSIMGPMPNTSASRPASSRRTHYTSQKPCPSSTPR